MKLLVVAGASGGHIFPALSFIDALKDEHPDAGTLLILPKNNFIHQQQLVNYKIRYNSTCALSLRPDLRNLIAALKFFKGSLEGLCVLLEFQPDVVVGFGSLVSVPLVLFAWIFRIKILIHEQNVIPGQANRFLANFADKIALSFQESRDYLGNYATKILISGNPIRRGLKKIGKNDALDFFGLNQDKFTILVMGGSQGSHRLNTAFLKGISNLRDTSKIQVIHLGGTKDQDYLRNSYDGLNIKAELFSFLKEMAYAYSACDLLVSRGGATTISEAIFFGVPAIIVPYPFAYAHQLKNAQVLERRGCAMIVKDSELDNDSLKRILQELTDNPDKLKNMRYNYNNIPQFNSAQLLANEAVCLCS